MSRRAGASLSSILLIADLQILRTVKQLGKVVTKDNHLMFKKSLKLLRLIP